MTSLLLQQQQARPQDDGPSRNKAVANLLREASTRPESHLLADTTIPEDRYGILQPEHPAIAILANPTIVIQRQLEMMNLLMGFEQANRYIIMDGQGDTIGYLAEQDHGFGSAIARQMARTHRSFTTHVFDRQEREVLRFHRPFSWINSRIRVYDAWSGGQSHGTSSALSSVSAGSLTDRTSSQVSTKPLREMRLIGESQQQWSAFKRKYNLFLHRPDSQQEDAPLLTSGDLPLSNSTAVVPVTEEEQQNRDMRGMMAQFAYVDEMLLSWDFTLRSETDEVIGSVNKNFAGFAREIFTDTSVYALRMDSAVLAAQEQQSPGEAQESGALGMTLDQRAVMLATAVSIDFDYFSRHSHAGGGWGFMPIWMGGAGEGAAGRAAGGAAGGAAGAEAGAAGAAGGVAASEGAAGTVTGAARGAGAVGAGEGAMAGAGTMAGYEAMQRGRQRAQEDNQDDASPMAGPAEGVDPRYLDNQSQPQGQQEEVWGEDSWFGGGSQGGQSGGDAPSGSEGGGGGGFDWGDFFGGDS